MSLGMKSSQQLGAKTSRRPGMSAPVPRALTLPVRAVAEAVKPGASKSASVSPIVKEIEDKLKYTLGKVKASDAHDVYQGTAWSAREHLIDSFENTHEYWA